LLKILHFWSLFFLFIISCAERDALNPFEASEKASPPLTLEITPYNQNSVYLEWDWTNNKISDYSGFRVYRAQDDSQNYTLYEELPPGVFSFTDMEVEHYHWYYYKVSIFGPNVESKPSDSQKTLLGPGQYWLLSTFGLSVRKLSYDLLHTLDYYETNYPSNDWEFSLVDSLIWLCFNNYGIGISTFNLKKGFEDFYYHSQLNSPINIENDWTNQTTFILDTPRSGDVSSLHILKNRTFHKNINLDSNEYFKLTLHNNSEQLFILSKKKLLIMNTNSLIFSDTLFFAANYSGQDFYNAANILYVLLASENENKSQISSFTIQGNIPNNLSVNGNFYRISVDEVSNSFILAERSEKSKDGVVKLSVTGNRLFEIASFNYIEDIKINPYDQSIIVVDRTGDKVYTIYKDGVLISQSEINQYYDPIRIFVE
jgi:hypothetical protein